MKDPQIGHVMLAVPFTLVVTAHIQTVACACMFCAVVHGLTMSMRHMLLKAMIAGTALPAPTSGIYTLTTNPDYTPA